jgi:hypothetical protein
MRDTAIGGVVRLFARTEWRDSSDGAAITETVLAALHDESTLVRMIAARAARALHADKTTVERVAAVGGLLHGESESTVQTVLLGLLVADAASAPLEVEAVLERFAASFGDDLPDAKGDLGRVFVDLLTYLAVVHQTPFARQTVERWMEAAPLFADEVQVVAQRARDYLIPDAGPAQPRAFQLLALATDAALERWTRNPEELLANAELSDDQRSALEGALLVTDTIADQIYFASGAFAHEQEHGPPAGASHATFANLAFPVLATCAGLRAPQCVHRVVETMAFLAPLDEKRALLTIAAAVPDDGSYTSDDLAGNEVISYLQRLLAGQRQLVLSDDEGVIAFRHLLAAFAAAGNESALALAFTFADVFR